MSHKINANSSIASAALLLGVSVESVILFHTEMKAWDLGQKLKQNAHKSPKIPENPEKNPEKTSAD